jgi:hypothetical protein
MTGFTITTSDNTTIRFHYYLQDAPVSSAAFHASLPLKITLYHARTSGQEFWAANVLTLDIIQENASVFTIPGEVVLGPLNPARVKTAGAIGIYYGDGKGLDAANIFAICVEDDMPLLASLGEKIWKQGEQELTFEAAS